MRPRLRGGILNDVSFVAKRVFPALAVFFFITAAITVLDIASHIQEFSVIPWLFIGYASLNVMRGIGFLNRERWLLYFFTLHAVATTVLGIVSTMLGTSPGLLPISVNIVLSWALWVLLFTTRHELTQSKWSILEAVVAFVIWLLVFTSTATQLLI